MFGLEPISLAIVFNQQAPAVVVHKQRFPEAEEAFDNVGRGSAEKQMTAE